MVEKPRYLDAPSNLASIGRYVLTPDIFDILRQIPAGSGNEIQLVDAIDVQARKDAADAVVLEELDLTVGQLIILFQLLIMNIARELGQFDKIKKPFHI